MQIDYGSVPRDVCDVISRTWARLPRDIQHALENVRFTYRQHERKSFASAGANDIDIRDLPISTDASVGIIAHEVAHVALKHAQRLTAGAITEQEAERQADDLLHQWGFTHELASRRQWIGR